MKFITLIPTHRNDGSPVDQAELQAIRARLWTVFGGASFEGPVTGYWIDTQDGQTYQDECLKATVVCDSERLAEAKAEVLAIGKQLDQKAMYFEVQYFDGVQILRVTE